MRSMLMKHRRLQLILFAMLCSRVASLPTAAAAGLNPLADLPDINPRQVEYKPGRLLLVYAPPRAQAGPQPAMVFVHGGGWQSGDPALFALHCRYYAAHGLVGISVGYRLAKPPETTVLDCVADVKSAVRWIRQHADELGVDPARIVVLGDSAGGHLAAATALLPGLDAPDDDLAVSARPDALVLFNPVIDTTPPDGWDLKSQGASVAARAADLSPMDHVRPGAPPTLVIHGSADTVTPLAWSERFVAAMRAAGNTARLETLQDCGHAFIVPGYGDSATVVRALDVTDAFLQRLSLGHTSRAPAATAIGDDGHYLRYAPKVYLHNPDGRAFTLTVRLMRWPMPSWNATNVTLRLSDPAGIAVVDGRVEFVGAARTLEFPTGPKGAYLLEVNLPARHPFGGPDFWVESSLERAVVYTGDPHATETIGNAIAGRWLLVQCSVPRRWWFWVPPGTKSFTARTQWIQNYQSQREDWGITIFSPRGQRVRTLWGDLDLDRGRPFDTPASRTASAVVNVEPGAAGRFWCVELRFADSHNYAKISFSLEGVPPYLARSPEEWFDPSAAEPLPAVPTYDDDAFMQAALDERTRAAWPWLQHFSPCPSLGDPDGAQVRGDAEFALWNPEDRPLRFRIGTYLPRPTPDGRALLAHVRITGADGRVVQEKDEPILHLHGDDGLPAALPATGRGVAAVSVAGTERWMAFTYPATPVVLLGRDDGHGWSQFQIEVGSARNWYFFVPKGTRSFAVRAAAQHDADRLLLEINAPDRTAELLYGRSGERTVVVPPGMDGKIWHLRADVGSGTVMETDGGPESRFLGIYATIAWKGVPGLLSPTWEQWFDPVRPVPAMERANEGRAIR